MANADRSILVLSPGSMTGGIESAWAAALGLLWHIVNLQLKQSKNPGLSLVGGTVQGDTWWEPPVRGTGLWAGLKAARGRWGREV